MGKYITKPTITRPYEKEDYVYTEYKYITPIKIFSKDGNKTYQIT